jgi:hypothetical protein
MFLPFDGDIGNQLVLVVYMQSMNFADNFLWSFVLCRTVKYWFVAVVV